VRYDVLIVERGPGRALPADGSARQQLGEQLGLLFEELFVVGQVEAEQGERVDAGAPPEDDLRPSLRDGVECGVALEHAHGIVGTEDGDRRAEADAGGARCDRGEDQVASRHREVVGVVLTDAEEVDADLLGEDALFDDVPNRLCV